MLAKLKHRFILINLTILLSIFFAIFGGTYYLMSKTLESQSLFTMEQIANNNGLPKVPVKDFNSPKTHSPIPINESLMRSSFTAFIDNDGLVTQVVSNLDEETDLSEIQNLVNEVFSQNKSFGHTTFNSLNLRYLRVERPEGLKIVFLDRENELSTLTQLAFVLIFIGLISIIVLSIISYYLATWAIKPVAKAWEKQQQFVADASHELRTPLTVIHTTTDVILANEEKTVFEQKKWLEHIKSETERMTKLVSDLLYLAKIDRNENVIKAIEFNLSEAIINATLPLESVVFESGKELCIDIEPDLMLIGEEERLQQVAIILLDNACKHAPVGSVIQINLQKQGDFITLQVINEGEGIPAEHLDKIFERFYRADESRARDTGGYGLGLSIAKTIVNSHNGTITAQSILNKTTTFTVTLPTKTARSKLRKV